MKRILPALIGFFALIVTNHAIGQHFIVQADTVFVSFSSSFTATDEITNISSVPTILKWHIIATNFPEAWLADTALGICDNNNCYTNIGDSLLWNGSTGPTYTMSPCPPNVPSPIDLSENLVATTDTTNGCYYLTINILEANDSYSKNITFGVCRSPTSVASLTNRRNEISFYPNPAGDEINVAYDYSSDVKTITVYNIIGNLVAVYNISGNHAILNLEKMPAGIYFARSINSQGEVVATGKFIKQ